MNNKQCCVCDELKPLTEYFKASMNRGLMGACKTCHTERNRVATKKYRAKRIIMRRLYNARPDRKIAAYENTKKMYRLYPEHQKARMKVYHAVRNGKLKKMPCEVCRELKVQAHHNDYTKPLEVVWLCVTHHKELHTQIVAK